jgi:hypothetical protein
MPNMADRYDIGALCLLALALLNLWLALWLRRG